MRITQPSIPEVIPPCPVQALRSGRGGKIEVAYIHCIDVREPEAFEIWAFAEDRIRKVFLYAWSQISDDFIEDTFYSHLFNAREIRNPFLGRRAVNGSFRWINVPRSFGENGSLTAAWTENTFFNSWGTNPTWFWIILSCNVQLRVFLSTSALLHADPITIAFGVFVLSGDKLLRESTMHKFSWTFLTRSFPMNPLMDGSKSPTSTDNLRILSTIWVSAFGSLHGSTCWLESIIVSTWLSDS